MTTHLRRFAFPLVLLLALAAGVPAFAAATADVAAIRGAIAAPDRPASDRADDWRRQPQAVLEFIGARPGMQVLDVFAGSGYYEELLTRIVGPKGRVVAYNNEAYAKFAEPRVTERYADGRLPRVERLTVSIEKLQLAPRSFDAAIFIMSFHDLYWRPGDGSWPDTVPGPLLAKVRDALKPDGIVVVEDHAATPGGDPFAVTTQLHRIDPARVRQEFEAAGFVLVRQSDALAHPEDDHSRIVFDPAIRGKTDQFLYLFRKR
jgi:predicted methyltransferase